MKLFKKLAMLCTALLATAGLGVATACADMAITVAPAEGASSSSSSSDSSVDSSSQEEDSSSEDEEQEANFVYRIKVQNAGGYGFKGIEVTLYDGETEIASKTTSSSGYATFGRSDIIALGNYTIKISDIPTGYVLSDPNAAYQTIAVEGFEAIVQIEPTGLLEGSAPIGTSYSLGDVMYDFSVTTSDGDTFTLSEVLKEKDVVLINFWATWCTPCKQEFPAMNNAYIEYEDNVGIIAVSTTDGMAAVREFKSTNGLTFPMTSNSESGANLTSYFNTGSIPLSVMVDRYGVVTFMHTGSMTQKTDFTSRFNKFIGENYAPTVIVGTGEDDETISGGEDTNLVKPNVDAPAFADVHTALGTTAGTDDKISYRWQGEKEDEYSWPWLVSENKDYVYTPITNVHGGYATLYVDFYAQPGDAVLFDYIISSEEDSDILYVLIDGVPIHQISGATKKDWQTCGAYVFREYEEAGMHEMTLLYLKDSETSVGDDIVKVKNLRVESSAQNVDSNIFRYAANVLNTDKNATKQFKDYITPVYNEEDGYYHVDSADGPLLFANMMLSSPWSDQSIWILAYYDYVIVNGYNFHSDIEDFAWEASNNLSITNGYTPVTKELKRLLQYAVAAEPIQEYGYKNWEGETYEEEWLELCIYYENYGNAAPMEDPLKTISFHAAEEVFAGTKENPVKNTANVPFAMNPRGFKYKFIPETSGVYNVYSVGTADSVCFLVAEDRTTFLGTYDDLVTASSYYDETGTLVTDGNFNFHYYMNAGETYYLLFTTYLDVVATYDFYIDYVGETYTYLENCSVGPYSYNEVSQEQFLPDALDYVYADPTADYDGDGEADGDGYYHVLNQDGTLGSVIYLDLNRSTAFFQSNSLYAIATDGLKYYDEDKRAFYIDGVDYSTEIKKLSYYALCNEGELRGFVPVDQDVFELINTIVRSEKYGGIEDSWQLLCYYYLTLEA